MQSQIASTSHAWARSVRWLHFGLAFTISIQLLSSQIMVSPRHAHDHPIGYLFLLIHEYDGLVAAAILLLHWLWLALDRQLFSHLFPWTFQGGRDIITDIQGLFRGQISGTGDRGGLPGFVHGLGLLTATAMGLTGVGIFLIFHQPHTPEAIKDLVKGAHSLIANLIWIYFGGHVLLAVIHEMMGHPVIRQMFKP